MEVLIPSPLRSYTGGRARVRATGGSLRDLLADIDQQFPGFRFRMVDEQGKTRAHMRIFVNGSAVFDLNIALHETDEVAIVQALSGG